jgi:eukaryotic-like serine/threonine-protein kinase
MDDRTLDINLSNGPQTLPLAGPAPESDSEPHIKQIGPYHLIKKIGEGGMGLVYEANQFEPIRRRVALKMVKRGMATEEFISRFESERQALAVMDHPCIARVLDAGATDEGQPFFVMEFVDGVPLNTYCDDKNMGIRDRLQLFIKVCEGVQHAHQKAVIHRDLKPGNVMVTTIDGQPVPKIIDFGVAKITDANLSETTMTTSAGQLVGTPEYMSPEQANFDNAAVDTTTDVYALGVLLYELLVGDLPFSPADLKDKSFREILRIIREVEPPKPSTRLGSRDGDPATAIQTVALHRDIGPDLLRRNLRGDLDWITMKALEKDKARRYETANALAMDIRRHLDFEPVRACPPSRSYKMQKFVRRHRTGVAAASFVIVAIFMGIFGTTIGMVRAVRAEKKAQLEVELSRQVSDFLVDLFEVADPDQARGNTITAREILDTGSQHIETELANQPLTQARLMQTIGKVYRNLGLFDQAGLKLESALALLQATGGGNEMHLASSLVDLADLYIKQAKYPEAEEILQQALVLTDKNQEGNSLQLALSLRELASVYRRQGRYDEAEPLYERARVIRVNVLGSADPLVAASYNSLAILNFQRGNYDQSEEQYLKALEIWRGAYGSNHSDVAKGLNNLALLYQHLDRHEIAEPIYQEAAVIYEKVLGPDHPRFATALNNLALVYFETQKYQEAEPLYLRALAIKEKALGLDHPDVAQTVNNLANLYRDQGLLTKAAPLYQRALTIRQKTFGPDHPDVAWSLRDIARLDHEMGRTEDALGNFDRAIQIYSSALGADHPDLVDFFADYARVMRESNQPSRADSLDQMAQAIAGKGGQN